MTTVTEQARSAVIENYRTRRSALMEEAANDERHRRPIGAARKRQAARLLSKAISDEIVDDQPSGLLRPIVNDPREGQWG